MVWPKAIEGRLRMIRFLIGFLTAVGIYQRSSLPISRVHQTQTVCPLCAQWWLRPTYIGAECQRNYSMNAAFLHKSCRTGSCIGKFFYWPFIGNPARARNRKRGE